jgi:DNA mismatch repair protein MutS2
LEKVRERAKGVLEHLLRQEELQAIFQEHFITLRNGRYVLLIKSDYKHRLEGIIHDQSQSRMTFFFEPLQVVTLNNEINILLGEQKEEEYRILAALSDKIREERQNLWNDFEILGELDLLFAMAKLSVRLKGVSPSLNGEGRIEMREARNPLLILQDEDRVVPITLRMGDVAKVLIVSGANAGGRFVPRPHHQRSAGHHDDGGDECDGERAVQLREPADLPVPDGALVFSDFHMDAFFSCKYRALT